MIPKIEKQNNISISFYGYKEKEAFPFYTSENNSERHMELLLLEDNNNYHYVLITDFNRLMYNKTKHKEKKHFCLSCLQCFTNDQVLSNHKKRLFGYKWNTGSFNA